MISAQVVTTLALAVEDASLTGPMLLPRLRCDLFLIPKFNRETLTHHTIGNVDPQYGEVGYDLESEELNEGSASDTSDEVYDVGRNHVVTVFPVAPGSLPRGPIKPPTRGGSGVDIKNQSQKLLEKRQADVKKKEEETKRKIEKKNEKK